jgi:hypothetical protein
MSRSRTRSAISESNDTEFSDIFLIVVKIMGKVVYLLAIDVGMMDALDFYNPPLKAWLLPMLDTATKNCQAKSMRLYGLDSEAGTVERIRRAIAADEGLTRSIAKAGGIRRDTVTYFTGGRREER